MSKSLSLSVSIVASLIFILATGSSAFAGEIWGYKSSHGMNKTEFKASQSSPATVNVAITGGGGKVTVTVEKDHQVYLDFTPNRTQEVDDEGKLKSIGPLTNCSSPSAGAPSIIGDETPASHVGAEGSRRAKAWRFTVEAGQKPVSYDFICGSDKLSVEVVPIDPPATVGEVKEARKVADDALAASNHGYKGRTFQVLGAFVLHLDTVGRDKDARGQRPSASQGFGLDVNVQLGGSSEFKVLSGFTFDVMSRQKRVAYAPNLPDNGFNGYVGWTTYFIGPKLGGDYMPTPWFQLQAWGSLGALVSVDGTIPISQLPDRTLYSGESMTKAALGYKALLNLNFIVAEHLVLGPAIGLEGNASKLPVERGPERICSATGGGCLVNREGHFVNFIGQLTVGGQF